MALTSLEGRGASRKPESERGDALPERDLRLRFRLPLLWRRALFANIPASEDKRPERLCDDLPSRASCSLCRSAVSRSKN